MTPAPFVTHDASFNLFTEDQSASAEVEALAEGGDTSGLLALDAAGQGSGSVFDFDTAFNGGPILPDESASVTIETDAAHPYLSFLSMLAFTNDVFLGVTTGDGAIDLFSGGTQTSQDFVLYVQDVWNAETEANDELASTVPALGGRGGVDEIGGVLTLGQHLGILGVGDVPLDRIFFDGPIAQLTVDPVPEPATMLLVWCWSDQPDISFQTKKRDKHRTPINGNQAGTLFSTSFEGCNFLHEILSKKTRKDFLNH